MQVGMEILYERQRKKNLNRVRPTQPADVLFACGVMERTMDLILRFVKEFDFETIGNVLNACVQQLAELEMHEEDRDINSWK